MRIPREHFSLRICFYNMRRDSLPVFLWNFFFSCFSYSYIDSFCSIVIIKCEEKCKNFTRILLAAKKVNRKEWRVGKDVEWRSSRNFKRYLVFLRPLKPPSTGLLCTFRLFKASRNTFLRKSRESRSKSRPTAAGFGNKNIREITRRDEKLIAEHLLSLHCCVKNSFPL